MIRLDRGRLTDLALVAAFVTLGELEVSFRQAFEADFYGPAWVNHVFVAAIALPLLFRRTYPEWALLVYWAPVQVWLDVLYDAKSSIPLEPLLLLLFMVYAATVYAARLTATRVILAVLVLSELVLLVVGRKAVGSVVPGLVLITLSHVVGLVVRTRREHAAVLQADVHQALESRDQRARDAVLKERQRIARELHDVVAHGVSIMVVQAGAGERTTDPARVHETFENIRRVGTEAMGELQRMLGLLGTGPELDGADPVRARMAALPDLVERAGSARLRVDGTVRELPPGVELTAYRLVQEALTNVRKHAPGATVEVGVHYGERALEVCVDNGPGREPPTLERGGYGLVGMRERVSLCDGTLEVGPRSGGGFRVRAELPYTDVPA